MGDAILDFASRHRGDGARPLPSPSGRRADRAGQEALAHVQSVSRSPARPAWPSGWSAASFADSVFFCNSGAEAIECGLKMVRKYQDDFGDPKRYRIICCRGAFHGRTLATIAAGGQEKHLAGFGPEVDGFDHVAYDNLNELRAAITERDRRDPGRAGAGRRRPAPGLARISAGPARRLRRIRPAAVPRRGPMRHGPHRQALRP